MKKYSFLVLAICLLMPGWASGEEIATEYNATTKDYEVTELGQVIVVQVKIEKNAVSWNLDEIDYYIAVYKASVKEYQKIVDDMKELRASIEAEVKKVRLSVGEETL